MSDAVDAYVDHLRASVGLRPSSVATTRHRLRALLQAHDQHALVGDLTPRRAARLYEERVATVLRPAAAGRPEARVSADTHRGELAAAQRWGAWCARQGWLPADPFARVEPVGAKRRGKPQLRIEEARAYLAAALAEDTPAALAAALPLLLGLRASEVTDRSVRDLDDGARVLWIDEGKTAAAARRVAVPEIVRPRLAALVAGRPGGEPLWGPVDRHWLAYHVVRLCSVAKVPRVTPHGLRGLHATLAVQHGTTAAVVASALGHTSADVTRRHYLADGAERGQRQAATLTVLAGGLVTATDDSVTSASDEPAKAI